MSKLRVHLTIPARRPDDRRSGVRVALMDTSRADALHPTVAEASAVLDPDRQTLELTLEVPRGALKERNRYSLWAHVDRVGDGGVHPGDLIVTQNIPVTISDTKDGAPPILVPLTRV